MKRINSEEEHHRRNKAICSWLEKHYHIKKKTVAEEAGFLNPALIFFMKLLPEEKKSQKSIYGPMKIF